MMNCCEKDLKKDKCILMVWIRFSNEQCQQDKVEMHSLGTHGIFTQML